MTTSPQSNTLRQHKIPASILFAKEELKKYRKWQTLHTTLKRHEQGYMPTAYEYDEFRQWLCKQDSGYFSDVFEDISTHIKSVQIGTSDLSRATLCQHEIHPAASSKQWLRCPPCTIDVHLVYIKKLSSSLQTPVSRNQDQADYQEHARNAWAWAKLTALSQVNELENLAEKEEEWLENNKAQQRSDMKTAKQALELYWFETSGFSMHLDCRTKKEGVVSFKGDTNFMPGRHAHLFWRKNPHYEPGKYVLGEEDEEDDQEDENTISEDSEDYTSSPDTFRTTYENEHHRLQYDGSNDEDPSDMSSLEWDDGDSDWEDVDSDCDDDGSSDDSYICLGDDETDYIVFSD